MRLKDGGVEGEGEGGCGWRGGYGDVGEVPSFCFFRALAGLVITGIGRIVSLTPPLVIFGIASAFSGPVATILFAVLSPHFNDTISMIGKFSSKMDFVVTYLGIVSKHGNWTQSCLPNGKPLLIL